MAHEINKKTLRIITFGCQMNVYDSQRMQSALASLDYNLTTEDDQADLIVINTCSVRAKPVQKLRSLLGRLAKKKMLRPHLRVVVAGCIARQEGDALLKKYPIIDLVLGPDQVGDIASLVAELEAGGQPMARIEDVMDPARVFLVDNQDSVKGPSAFVSIMKGCNLFCSYCIVPLVRGREMSRPSGDIIAHCQALVDKGVREITLLGQNVNRYGLGQAGFEPFHELLARVHDIPGLYRLGFVTSNPGDCPRELVELFSSLPKLASFFHLPMQSGSNRILKAMNRRYTREEYLELVQSIRLQRPGINLSTDLIVGFPSETEEDFQETLSVARQIGWGASFSFAFSPRPGTRAAQLPDDVPPEVKARRLAQLQTVLHESHQEAMRAHLGSKIQVLVEGKGRDQGQLSGRSWTNYVVNFLPQPPAKLAQMRGQVVEVLIEEIMEHSLLGRQHAP